MFYTFKVEVGTFGVLMTSSVVLETAADWQLFDLTGESVSDVVVLTGALLLPLLTQIRYINTTHSRSQHVKHTPCCPHRSRHGADGMFVAAAVDPGDTRVDGLTGEAVSGVTFRTGAGHLLSCLRTLGSFSTTAIPGGTHVHHYRQTDGQTGRHTDRHRDAT